MERHPGVEYFCLFMGYPKSGHSLVGSLLDAHPDIIIAHEQDVIHCLHRGINREFILFLLLGNSLHYAGTGRKWRGYSYFVPNQWNGRYRDLRVIGDKKGSATVERLYRYPALMETLKREIPLDLKFVHVIRNPFDTISTIGKSKNLTLDQCIDKILYKYKAAAELKKSIGEDNIFDLYHEEFIKNPRYRLKKLCRFLGQDTSPGYLDDCAGIVNPEPHRSRFEVTWSRRQIRFVEQEIKKYSFLEGYSYESG
jgi:hypothetical protein